VSDAISNIDGRTAQNTDDIAKLSGLTSLVQQEPHA
jgi:hypothetical protein